MLIRRAELLMHMERLQQVVADLDAVLSDEASVDEYARFSARYLRGGAHFGLGQWASAIKDYNAVVDDQRAPDATRLSARLRRGVAHQKAGSLQAAKADYEAVLADPRASDSTRRVAQHNLDDAMRAG